MNESDLRERLDSSKKWQMLGVGISVTNLIIAFLSIILTMYIAFGEIKNRKYNQGMTDSIMYLPAEQRKSEAAAEN